MTLSLPPKTIGKHKYLLMINNYSKISYKITIKIIFIVEYRHNIRNYTKGSQH